MDFWLLSCHQKPTSLCLLARLPSTLTLPGFKLRTRAAGSAFGDEKSPGDQRSGTSHLGTLEDEPLKQRRHGDTEPKRTGHLMDENMAWWNRPCSWNEFLWVIFFLFRVLRWFANLTRLLMYFDFPIEGRRTSSDSLHVDFARNCRRPKWKKTPKPSALRIRASENSWPTSNESWSAGKRLSWDRKTLDIYVLVPRFYTFHIF